METGISVERAVALLRASVQPLGAETVSAPEALGRVLAEDVTAPLDQPPWPRSPLDGYALRATDSAGASRETPVTLPVWETLFAGSWPGGETPAGHAVRLTTGAPIPSGCDCVIRQEDTDGGTEQVRVFRSLETWDNYCFQGGDFRTGDVLLPAGTRLDGCAMGILAAAGLCRKELSLRVHRTPRCALICTGDELTERDSAVLPRGHIYSSNAALLEYRLRELGMELTVIYERFPDDAAALADTLRLACGTSDIVFTTGGVSVGARDILHEALPLLPAERVLWRVNLKPGSPLMYSTYEGVPILSLSGNPFAAAATFELFGRQLLAVLARREDLKPQAVRGTLREGFPKSGRRFVRGVFRDGVVTLPQGHSSGVLRSAAGTNCLAEIPAGVPSLPPGSEVTAYLL
ncbi:MAG: molybdopterin molybdotransferase MoeA [Oscillospiraceae bacterium]|nr:molybdopterin molybdotransferase MoeA [Oscillospiraceae bacterium]